MAHIPLRPLLLLLLCSIIVIIQFTKMNASFAEQPHIELPDNSNHHHDHQKREKVTQLHFFYHDILKGETPTVVQIIDTKGNSPNGLGTTFMMDNKLTESEDLNSKEIGRAQGMFGLASIYDRGMVMLINFAFGEGEFQGSTLSMLGRNPVEDTVREMAIVGGTGLFRFARGYAVAKSLWALSTDQHFVVEYNVTVSHP